MDESQPPAQDTGAPLPLAAEMRCGVFSNAGGQILIVHDQEIGGAVQWLEFDQPSGQIFMVFDDGEIRDLGIRLDNKMRANLAKGTTVNLAQIIDREVRSVCAVALVVRAY